MAVLVVCILAVSGSAASAAPDYRYHAVPWPGGVVRYYNAVPSQGWALWQAVAAWNRSGARVRFVATSKRRAQLVIRTDPSVASCEKASATVGYVRRATVLIFPRNDRSQRCNKYTAARALAHELGHVLGLLHENGGCAAMNSSGSYRGAAMCASGRDWEWRCRLLEGDDVRGIAALYGGAAKPDRRPSPLCPLYDSVTPPREVAASYVPETGVVLTFGAAADPTVPPFLAGLRRGPRGFAYLRRPNVCPAPGMFASATRGVWPPRSRAEFSVAEQLPPGTYCYAAWSIDTFGRPSSRVATTRVDVPPPMPPPTPPPPPPPPAP